MLRKLVVVAGSVAILAAGSPAHAAPWAGSCALDLTFDFTSPVRPFDPVELTVSRPSYSISVAQSKDLNPLTEGVQACVIASAALNPLRSTWAWGDGTSSVWTCEATDAGGDWNQGWSPSPPLVNGSHLIEGGPDGWTMTVHNSPTLTFAGTMQLAVHPDDAEELAECQTAGITSLTMTGVLVFEHE